MIFMRRKLETLIALEERKRSMEAKSLQVQIHMLRDRTEDVENIIAELRERIEKMERSINND